MYQVKQHISRRQSEFRTHSFVVSLSRPGPDPVPLGFAPALAFWVHAFQDLLHLNETRMSDDLFRKVARHHRAEDAGHDRWYLEDLAVLGRDTLDVRELFATQTRAIREASYSLLAEVFRCDADALRVVLLLTLESAGHVFFEAAATLADRAGLGGSLKYFSRFHLDVEKRHELFESDLESRLMAVELSLDSRHAALALVDRVYAAFTLMFDQLAPPDPGRSLAVA